MILDEESPLENNPSLSKRQIDQEVQML